MIEAVSTSPVQSGSLRPSSQNGALSPAVEAAVQADAFFISSRIRVDTELDKAILEFRSSETGDVIRQYPTESQIRAFQRASQIAAEKEAAALSSQGAQVEQQPSLADTHQPAPVAAAAPVATGGAVVSTSLSSAGEATVAQSVLV